MGDENENPTGDPGAAAPAEDFASLPAETQAYIKNLRAESARYRTQNKVLSSQLAKLGDAPAQIRKLSIDNHLLGRGDVDPQFARFLLSEENALDDLDVTVDGWTSVLDDRLSD